MNKQLSKEQEKNKKELKEIEKAESLQGDVIEDDLNKTIENMSKEESKQEDSSLILQVDSGDKVQDDSGKNEESKQPVKKPIVILTPEEIKDKLENHIDDIGNKIETRMKLSKRLLLRSIDKTWMDSLAKAIKTLRQKEQPCELNKRRSKNNSIK